MSARDHTRPSTARAICCGSSPFRLHQYGYCGGRSHKNKFHESDLEPKLRIKLELNAEEPLEILSEPKDIHSLISNLITNAIDTCNADQDEQKTHRVTVRAYHDKDDTVIEVEDDGVGMDSATRSVLFKGMVSTKGNSGTGLGLLMSQKVATEHGGSIRVASKLGKGSVFTVRLPVRQQDATSTKGEI